MKPTILAVDDTQSILEMYQMSLRGFTVLTAETTAAALDLYAAHRNQIDVVVLDGHLAAGTTLGLIRDLRMMGYAGPMIAASSDPDLRVEMIRASCTHSIVRDKREVRSLVSTILRHEPVP